MRGGKRFEKKAPEVGLEPAFFGGFTCVALRALTNLLTNYRQPQRQIVSIWAEKMQIDQSTIPCILKNMADSTIQRHCGTCGQKRPFSKKGVNHILHLLLSIVTVGFWIPVWLLVGVCAALTRYRCQFCGQAKF